MFDYFVDTPINVILTDAGDIALRALIAVLTLFLLAKFMGEKQLAELSFFDYIEGITIGSIGAELAVNPNTPHLFPILAMVVFAIVSKLMGYISLKSTKARKFINGTPVTLISDGEISYEGLKMAQITVNELLAELRIAGYFDIADVQYAYMESSGKFSFAPYPNAKPVTCSDMNIKGQETTLNYVVILDGVLVEDNLDNLNITKDEVYDIVKQNSTSIEDVLLLTLTSDKQYKIYEK